MFNNNFINSNKIATTLIPMQYEKKIFSFSFKDSHLKPQ